MKAVMMSIQPKWCELIESGKKTIEVRKTRPKLETPFKCYIYETKAKDHYAVFHENTIGKVIGEFVCDDITYLGNIATDPWKYLSGSTHEYHKKLVIEKGCLTENEILYYGGQYAWHISNLVIYDEPKELSEFYRLGNPLICDGRYCENCNHLKYMQVNSDEWDYDCDCQHQLENRITLKRPPQSWCYVEELV